MTIYQVLCLIGVPTLILAVFKYLWSQIKHNTEDSKALKAGIQALLRAQMISDFNKRHALPPVGSIRAILQRDHSFCSTDWKPCPVSNPLGKYGPERTCKGFRYTGESAPPCSQQGKPIQRTNQRVPPPFQRQCSRLPPRLQRRFHRLPWPW